MISINDLSGADNDPKKEEVTLPNFDEWSSYIWADGSRAAIRIALNQAFDQGRELGKRE